MNTPDAELIDRAVALATELQRRATALQTPEEERQQAELDRMLRTPEDKVTLIELTDRAFRSHRAERVAEQFTHILDVQGIPRFFSPLDRALLRGFKTFGQWLPGVSVPLVQDHMQRETENVVLPAETEVLTEHLRARAAEGLRMNVNFLGEALLGENEAANRMDKYLAALRLPEVEVLSVKISTICSQISPVAREHTLRVLSERLARIFRAAADAEYVRPDGSRVPKFIYLDMEEYRDLHLTASAFMRALELPDFKHVSAGIALQAYVPDSARVQRIINAWAEKRVAAGGAPVRIRLVKGANLEAERVEASLRGWPQAPFLTKRETDANFKRMLREGMRHLDAVQLGVGSHNLFDVAFGLVLAADMQAGGRVEFEMLEGMANHQRRALHEKTGGLLLYAPACRKEDFINAIGYLIRRLDENTGEENFLRHAFRLQPGTEDWRLLERGFRESFEPRVSDEPRRTQDRRQPLPENARPEMTIETFENEPDTDFSLPHHSEWAEELARQDSCTGFARIIHADPSCHSEERRISDHSKAGRGNSQRFFVPQNDNVEAVHSECEASGDLGDDAAGQTDQPHAEQTDQPQRAETMPAQGSALGSEDKEWQALKGRSIPLVIDGDELRDDRPHSPCVDPSRPGIVLAHHAQAAADDVDRAVACARADADGWRAAGIDARNEILGRVAQELRRARAALIRAAIAEGGKTVIEADAEVSEAVDFLEFYRLSARRFFEMPDLIAEPVGVVAVVPPWNFPIAIPCGGIAAALAAGNTVIVKPASPAVLIAWELCQCFWRAGISRRVLQFLPCPGSSVAERLVTHDGVDAVILTGGTETARRMFAAKPDMRLFAETGGKNAIIVTALADREQAIKHVVHSAFGHAGQKCSAASLLLLEAEVYDDDAFRRMLADATESLPVGSAWDLVTRVNPMIRPPVGDLLRALTQLESDESWLVQPRQIGGDNPNLWSPGIKYGVQPGSFTHLTEFFGPVLGVMRCERLEDAIALVNATGYGLTSGIQTLDEREIEQWKESVHAGNLYINKPIVGAIVLRQPFGGFGKSGFGPGLKAGGPNYVAQFIRFADGSAGSAGSDRSDWPNFRIPDGLREHPDSPRLLAAIESYEHAWRTEFAIEHDTMRLLGEDNIRRYEPIREVRVRVHPRDSWFEILARVFAVRAVGSRVVLSVPPGETNPAAQASVAICDETDVIEETDACLAQFVRETPGVRLRCGAPDRVPLVVRVAAVETGACIADAPVVANGFVELLWHVREQSVSHSWHRYGNLGARQLRSS